MRSLPAYRYLGQIVNEKRIENETYEIRFVDSIKKSKTEILNYHVFIPFHFLMEDGVIHLKFIKIHRYNDDAMLVAGIWQPI